MTSSPPVRVRRRRTRRLTVAASAAGLGAAGLVAVAPEASADDSAPTNPNPSITATSSTSEFFAAVYRRFTDDITQTPATVRLTTDLVVPTATCEAGDTTLPVGASLAGSYGEGPGEAGGGFTVTCRGGTATYTADSYTYTGDPFSYSPITDGPKLTVRPGDRLRVDVAQDAGRIEAAVTVVGTGATTIAGRDAIAVSGADISMRLDDKGTSPTFEPVRFRETLLDGAALVTGDRVASYTQVDADGSTMAEPVVGDGGRTVTFFDRR